MIFNWQTAMVAKEVIQSKTPEKDPEPRGERILLSQAFIDPFFDLAEAKGFKLYEVEFDKTIKRKCPDGRTIETTFPVSIKPAKKNQNKSWDNHHFLLNGKDATYYIEFDTSSEFDGNHYFLGVTKTSPFEKAKDKADWVDTLTEGKGKPAGRIQSEKPLPSISLNYYGGTEVTVYIHGDYDELLETYYQTLTQYGVNK